MAGTTTKYGIPFPNSGSDPCLPGTSDIENVATGFDAIVASIFEVAAASATAGKLGRFYWTSDTGVLVFDNGTSVVQAWPPVAIPALATYGEKLVSVAPVGGVCTLDLSQGNEFAVSLTGADSVAFANVPATSGLRLSVGVSLIQDATGGRTAAWPGSVDWGTAGAPTLSTGANKVDFVGFVSDNNGGRWMGFVGALGF